MALAGPVEFSATYLIGALAFLVVIYVILPAGAGLLAVRKYRSTRPPDQQTPLGAAASFVAGAVGVMFALGFIAWVSEGLL